MKLDLEPMWYIFHILTNEDTDDIIPAFMAVCAVSLSK